MQPVPADVMTMNPTKVAEPIKMSFGGADWGQWNQKHVLDRGLHWCHLASMMNWWSCSLSLPLANCLFLQGGPKKVAQF